MKIPRFLPVVRKFADCDSYSAATKFRGVIVDACPHRHRKFMAAMKCAVQIASLRNSGRGGA